MNAKRTTLALIIIALLPLILLTRIFSNSLMLLMDRENFIPSEASVFTLNPYVINEGSSSYWLYAEDSRNYYYFSHEPGREYLIMSKDQPCPSLKRDNFKTWCKTKVRTRQSAKPENTEAKENQ